MTLVGKSTLSAAHDEDGFASTLATIKAKGLIMPCKTDLYFPVRVRVRVTMPCERLFWSHQPEDSEFEVSLMKNNAKLVVINSVWGHMGMLRLGFAQLAHADLESVDRAAGGGANADDDAFLKSEITKFLEGA